VSCAVSRQYDTGRETVLLAYERVTPARTREETRLRNKLLDVAQLILQTPLRMRQTRIPGT
jgi:hypothetical protein